MTVATIQAPHGPVFEFLVLFAVILVGPIVFTRFRLPGLIGLLLGGFAIGPHGLGLISAGNHTVPELGHLGLLYLMFVAGLELDLLVLRAYGRAAVLLGLLAFAIPFSIGLGAGWALGWSLPAMCLLGALLSSHTLITYPILRDAGAGGHPAVATAVGATVLTDVLALVVLAVVAGTQTGSGSPGVIVAEIALGFGVLIVVGLFVLPRVVDWFLRQFGGDRVTRYVVIVVALLFMSVLAEVFGIEGIVGAFFAGLALNRLVPNEGPSMERVEFFGAAVFVPVFVVSIGLLLDPSVMFTSQTLALAAILIGAALGGKAAACWISARALGFTRVEGAAMYVLTVPQAAATLAVTLIGFEIGLFGTHVVNAVLALILVSIVFAAVLAERVAKWLPARSGHRPPLGSRVLVVAPAGGPSEAAVRAATLVARPDGGHASVVIACSEAVPRTTLRDIERMLARNGLDGHVRADASDVGDALARAILIAEPSLAIVDDAAYDAPANALPVVVMRDGEGPRVLVDDHDGLAAEIARRLG